MPEGTDLNDLLHRIVERNSTVALVLLAAAIFTWIIGGGVILALHRRRLGGPIWSWRVSFRFPFTNFNTKEWLLLALLAVITFGLIITGVAVNNKV